MKIPASVTLPLSVFVGAVVSALAMDAPGTFFTMASAKPALVGALLAGLGALVHLYQPVPGSQEAK